MQTKRIAFSAIFCALVFVATMYVRIPFAIGYFNLGDAFILVSAVCCGPVGGALSGLVGATLADLVSGYAIYAPFTLVVKGVEGLLCGILFKIIKRKKKGYFPRVFAAFFVSLVWMIAGYFFTDGILYGIEAAIADGLACNALQAGISLAVAGFIFVALAHIPYVVGTFNLKDFENDKRQD